VHAAAFLLALAAPFALDGDRVVGYVDLHVVLVQPRKIGVDDELVGLLGDLDLRNPRHRFGGRGSAERTAKSQAEVAEHAIDFVRKAFEWAERTRLDRVTASDISLFLRHKSSCCLFDPARPRHWHALGAPSAGRERRDASMERNAEIAAVRL